MAVNTIKVGKYYKEKTPYLVVFKVLEKAPASLESEELFIFKSSISTLCGRPIEDLKRNRICEYIHKHYACCHVLSPICYKHKSFTFYEDTEEVPEALGILLVGE